jgi:hypothetical protein
MISLIRSLAFSLFIFGLLGWFYIVVTSWIFPASLPLPLSHLTLWIREDTFGIVCFIVSFLSFFVWTFTKQKKD